MSANFHKFASPMLDPNKIASFCEVVYGQPICPTEGAANIVYIEGLNPDGTENDDKLDGWNDLRLLVGKVKGEWQILFSQVATTEPGRFYTEKPMNKNGAARIAFGYHPPAWAEGLHKGKFPALVQRKPVLIHRDLNRDGKRNESEKSHMSGLIGLNHHSTSLNFKGKYIGRHGAGCKVGYDYLKHLDFLQILRFDPRRVASEAMHQEYLHDDWVLPGDDFAKFTPKAAV